MTMPASFITIHDTGRLFEPDTILPTQFSAMFKNSKSTEPDRSIRTGILADAVSCLLTDLHRSNLRQRKQYEEAKAWVTANEESECIFSFKNIFEVFGMDPSYLRRGLIRLKPSSPIRSRSVIVMSRRPSRNVRSLLPQKKIRIRTTS